MRLFPELLITLGRGKLPEGLFPLPRRGALLWGTPPGVNFEKNSQNP
jgi:hypothetical protein